MPRVTRSHPRRTPDAPRMRHVSRVENSRERTPDDFRVRHVSRAVRPPGYRLAAPRRHSRETTPDTRRVRHVFREYFLLRRFLKIPEKCLELCKFIANNFCSGKIPKFYSKYFNVRLTLC